MQVLIGGSMGKDENLSARKREILINAVEEYIQSASPITSSNVRNKCFNDLSTATLRNELNALEAMGYLKQLHTSSGRVPTAQAYRYYVNEVMHEIPTDVDMLDQIQGIFENRAIYLNDVVNEIADVVSKATNYPTVVMLKGFDKLLIKNVKIVPLITGQALILIETNSGIIHNFMQTKTDTPAQTYVDASNFLTTTFVDKPVSDMIKNIEDYRLQMGQDLLEFEAIFDKMIESLKALSEEIANKTGVTARGQIQLLNSPEYQDLSKAKKVMDMLANPSDVGLIFDNFEQDNAISFKIGNEIGVAELEDCAIAKADYQINGESIASIGIIGPQRMDYIKIASALKFVVGEYANLKQIENSTKGDDNEQK